MPNKFFRQLTITSSIPEMDAGGCHAEKQRAAAPVRSGLPAAASRRDQRQEPRALRDGSARTEADQRRTQSLPARVPQEKPEAIGGEAAGARQNQRRADQGPASGVSQAKSQGTVCSAASLLPEEPSGAAGLQPPIRRQGQGSSATKTPRKVRQRSGLSPAAGPSQPSQCRRPQWLPRWISRARSAYSCRTGHAPIDPQVPGPSH